MRWYAEVVCRSQENKPSLKTLKGVKPMLSFTTKKESKVHQSSLMLYIAKFMVASHLLSACGAKFDVTTPRDDQANNKGKRGGNSEEAPFSDPFFSKEISGFVVSAFDVNVDGQAYRDLEDFYTQELKRLPEKVKAAGIDQADSVVLDAEIGFKDLWHQMEVFIVSEGKSGYQGRTFVGYDGGFSLIVPGELMTHTYKIRAVKRINIIIRKGENVKKFCYNFSAKDISGPLNGKSEPVLINSFYSEITAYQCQAEVGTGIIIPTQMPATPASITIP
jgi:hypothetical protein